MLGAMSPPGLFSLVLLLVVSGGWAVLLRWTRCPGFSVVGGVAAGLLLGPTILGRVAPDVHQAIFVGGVQEHRELRQIISRQGADRLAAEVAGLAAASPTELEAEQATARDRRRDARWSHQRPQRVLMAVLVAVMLAGAAPAVPRGDRAPSTVGALSIGGWSAALPGGLAWLAARGLWEIEPVDAMLVAGAVAIGPWAMTAVDRDAADQAETGGAATLQAAGRYATVIGIGLTAAALWTRHGAMGLLWSMALAAAVAGWLLPAPAARGRAAAVVRGTLRTVVVPTVAAAVTIRLDLLKDLAIWPVVVIMLLSGDGRWLGAFTGAQILGGRPVLRTMRLVMGSMAAGTTQLAVTAIALCTWSIGPQLGLALLLGAVFIEVTAPARSGVARRLAE